MKCLTLIISMIFLFNSCETLNFDKKILTLDEARLDLESILNDNSIPNYSKYKSVINYFKDHNIEPLDNTSEIYKSIIEFEDQSNGRLMCRITVHEVFATADGGYVSVREYVDCGARYGDYAIENCFYSGFPGSSTFLGCNVYQ